MEGRSQLAVKFW